MSIVISDCDKCSQMLSVRGALTEILLEVTNEEIRSLAGETLSKNRLKGMVFSGDWLAVGG